MARKQYLKHFDSPDVLSRIEAGRLMSLIEHHAGFFAGHGYELRLMGQAGRIRNGANASACMPDVVIVTASS